MMKKIDKLRMSRYAMVWGMLFSALWLFAVAPLQAQTEQDKVLAEQGTKTQVHQEAKKIFVNMPDSLSPLLTAVNRADCIDFLESKMKAKVENRFGRESEMTELSKDYIRVQMTPQSTWQMKLLATSDTTQVSAPSLPHVLRCVTAIFSFILLTGRSFRYPISLPLCRQWMISLKLPILLLPMSIIMPAYKRICC